MVWESNAMHPIGYSTGALARGDWQTGLTILKDSNFTAIEISVLREWEFQGFMAHLSNIDVSQFDYVFFHCPKIEKITEQKLTEELVPIFERGWLMIVHPYMIQNTKLWRKFGSQICIENMGTSSIPSKAKNCIGQTVESLNQFFNELPDASMCFDIGHTIQLDPTMDLTNRLIDNFRGIIKTVHLSEVDHAGKHLPLTLEPIKSLGSIINKLPLDCSIILESDARESYEADVALIHEHFADNGIKVIW